MNAGTKLREEAIQQVKENADADWITAAEQAVEFVASKHELFTTDDVWDLLYEYPREPRAMGAVMRRAQADGIIAPTENWWLSRRPVSHRRPLRVWKSI